MDGNKFDQLTRSLASGLSRRQMIKGLAGGAAGALGALVGARHEAGAEACREIRYPCEGGQECCPNLGCVAASFEGQSERCCPPGQSGCGLECCPIGSCCQSGNQQICLTAGQCCTAATCPTPSNPCSTAGVCGEANIADGTACDDGNACTSGDTCQAGVCTGGTETVCTALDQCHDAGTCDPATGVCSNPNAADGTGCDDGDACTQTDTYVSGAYVGANPVVCTAADQCHDVGACDAATGICSNPAKTNGTPCDDGLFCTSGDTCQNGACTGGASPCNAANCEICDEANGRCISKCPVGTQCDGNGNCAIICTNRNNSVFCPSKTGHGFKCCPTDSVCDYRGNVVNCRNI